MNHNGINILTGNGDVTRRECKFSSGMGMCLTGNGMGCAYREFTSSRGMGCASPLGGTLQLKIQGGWLDSLGSEIWLEKIFWGSSKILIWTIVRG